MTPECTTCPVCNHRRRTCKKLDQTIDTLSFHCEGCGRFDVSDLAFSHWLHEDAREPRLTPIQRAALSHWLRTIASSSTTPFRIEIEWIRQFAQDEKLPSQAVQAENLIALIGDSVSANGEGLILDDRTHQPLIGAFNSIMLEQLIEELIEHKLIRRLQEAIIRQSPGGSDKGFRYGLTFQGWERYNARKRGRFAGRYGFVAMQFEDPVLDPLIRETVKPALQAKLNYDLVDMRDVAQAGVIDNLMRARIRDSAFVLADLTHDNSGAYWEAGYAEGLGKPVIYLVLAQKPIRVILINELGSGSDGEVCAVVTRSSVGRSLSLV